MDRRRHFLFTATAFLVLSACAGQDARVAVDVGGQPLPVRYRIDPAMLPAIRARVLDRANLERLAHGAMPLRLNPELNTAAQRQSRALAVHGLRGHIGLDGSSPADRARAAGYGGTVFGETLSETYLSDLATLAAWLQRADTRDVILDACGQDMGFGYHQDATGKIWWTLLIGAQDAAPSQPK